MIAQGGRTPAPRRRPLAAGLAIDRMMVRLALRAERSIGRVSWRLGRGSAASVRAAHEALRRLGGAAWEAADPSSTRAFQEAPPADPPSFPGFDPPGDSPPPLAEALRRGEYAFGAGLRVPLASIVWTRHPEGMDSLRDQFLFYSLFAVEALLRAHELTGRDEDLERAKAVAAAWLDACGKSERSTLVWDDHITATRALTLARLWERTRRREPPAAPFARRLVAALARHAERLAMPEFYRAEHNHGVTQAYALLALSDAMRLHPRAGGWDATARRRLERQMEENVSRSGVHREHSPYYHFYVLRQFLDAARFTRSRGAALSPGYEERLRAMAEAGAHMVRPDGGLPALGDSDRNAPVLLRLEDLDGPPLEGAPAFRYARTEGKGGVAPARRALLDPDGGVAFLRSGWGEREPWRDERHLAVRLGVFPTTHIHRDLLSFEFAAYGEDLIVDSGGPYAYGDPLRESYFLRTRAHNTIEVDGADQRIAAARVLRVAEWPGGHFIEAEHDASEGVRHRRALAMLPHGLLLVLDRLDADRERRFDSALHLSPRLTARVEGTRLVATRATRGPTARILYVGSGAAAPALVRGSDMPPQGWVATGDGTREDAAVAVVSAVGSRARLATLIAAEPAGRPRDDIEASLEGDPWETGGAIVLTEAGRRITLRVPAEGAPALEVIP
ncbi:MAG TPA: alginate lyase family protein [Candidatus Eisenbacteria bacterium]